ncbi:MAG: cupin domain-containing protein [Candidatus Brocadiaceae bacterium]|nr:cupin domain-containing protein [Candidatus Brocadiaceae bacterium]
MKIVTSEQVSPFQNAHGVLARRLHDTEHVQVVQIDLEPGQGLKSHVTPVDVFFYVVRGDATVQIGEERECVPVGSLVHSPAGIPHLVANEGETHLRFLVVKTPNPGGRK